MMTLSSITADVHELQVRCYYGPCQVKTVAAFLSVHLLNVGIDTNMS